MLWRVHYALRLLVFYVASVRLRLSLCRKATLTAKIEDAAQRYQQDSVDSRASLGDPSLNCVA